MVLTSPGHVEVHQSVELRPSGTESPTLPAGGLPVARPNCSSDCTGITDPGALNPLDLRVGLWAEDEPHRGGGV
jgi:hypothetical protein